ncbi:DNA adenine methylase [Sphingomonas sp. CJ99]
MESITTDLTLEPVTPCVPPAPYIGGKRALSQRLVARIDAIPHALYAEPFVGMGGVFFRRRMRPRVEVINDISTDVVTLFRILQRHRQSFLEELKWRLCSRAEFKRLTSVDPDTLTDLERAARFLYLQKAGFGGKVVGRAYGIDYANGARFNLTKLVPLLEDVHERLASVQIEQLPWERFIERYDRPGTLFYLDPPYFDCETDYGPGVFSKADFERLSARLEAIEGRFILSINDTPEVRSIFAQHTLEPAALNYRLSGKVTPARELIITPR